MNHRLRAHYLAALAAAFVIGIGGAGIAQAQGATAKVSIDSPSAGMVVGVGQVVFIGGWAADPQGQGTGVNGVDVYLDGPPSTGMLLGSATYGGRRPDVAAAFGKQTLINSGFEYVWVPRGVPGGDHTLYVAARTQAGPVVVESVAVSLRQSAEAGCTFVRPCLIYHNSLGWEVDTGGPGTKFEYFDTFPER